MLDIANWLTDMLCRVGNRQGLNAHKEQGQKKPRALYGDVKHDNP